MKILINLSIIRSGGGLQVAHSFINELQSISGHTYCVLVSSSIQRLFANKCFSDNFFFHLITPSPSELMNGRKSRKKIQRIEGEFKPDVVFTLFGPSYWRPRTLHICGFALAQHLYKESPYFKIIPFKEKITLAIRERIKLFSFRNHCDYWITETKDVADRLAARLNVPREKVFTVSNVYNGVFYDPTKWKHLSERIVKAHGFKLITISSFHIHKNLAIIPQVIDNLCASYPDFDFTFILTVDESNFKNLSARHKRHMLFLGTVALNECPGLYKASDALFMPTLLECFTVSYLEAMKMEKPILTSNLPFARDICKCAALYFDSMNPEDIGEKIINLARSHERQKELIQNGLECLKDFGTAADRAKAYINILEKKVTEKTL